MAESKKNNPLFIILGIIAIIVVIVLMYPRFVTKTTMVETEAVEENIDPVTGQAVEDDMTMDNSADDIEVQDADDSAVVQETNVIGEEDTASTEEASEYTSSFATEPVSPLLPVQTVGSDDAPIKVLEYSSLRCGHCGAFHNTTYKELKEKYIDTGEVQMVFRELPLNKPALDASMILRCMPEDKYVSFMTLLFESQDSWAYDSNYLTSLRQNAKLAGMTDSDFDACLENKELEAALLEQAKTAEKWNIRSTPSFVVNNGQAVLTGNQPLSRFEEAFGDIK